VKATFDPRKLAADPAGSVISIGVFDGVHLGHQAILAANVARARELDAVPTVVTFRRHPKRVILGRAPRTLTTLEHRLELFARAGIEHAVALTFDDELRELAPENFARDHLERRLGVRAFVLGFDSRFGHGRRGTPELLRSLGYRVHVVDKVVVGGKDVSSTAIREHVELGDLDAAAAMLGRRVGVIGRVVRGDARGRELGFPTANLDLHHELHPPVGVYACRARRLGDRAAAERPAGWDAVANIGYRPTIADSPVPSPRVEVHLLEFRGDLYGERLELEFVARLRGEERFGGLAELRAQIAADVEAAREALAAG